MIRLLLCCPRQSACSKPAFCQIHPLAAGKDEAPQHSLETHGAALDPAWSELFNNPGLLIHAGFRRPSRQRGFA